MNRYPVSGGDDLSQSLNYLLSGPASSGQNFEGTAEVGLPALVRPNQIFPEAQTYLTGQQVAPTTVNRYTGFPAGTLYYPQWVTLPGGLAITNITPVAPTGKLITVDFSTATGVLNASEAPFCQGQVVTITGVTPSAYDGVYTVVDCGETDFGALPTTLTLQAAAPQTWPTYTSGGALTINSDFTGLQTQIFSLGLAASVNVTGPTDRVFISTQLTAEVYSYTKFTTVADYQPTVDFVLLRYRAIEPTTLPDSLGPIGSWGILDPGPAPMISDGYRWAYDQTLVSASYALDWESLGVEVKTTNIGTNIINTIIDSPGLGYFKYVLAARAENYIDVANDDYVLVLGAHTTGVRSITAQTIKR